MHVCYIIWCITGIPSDLQTLGMVSDMGSDEQQGMVSDSDKAPVSSFLYSVGEVVLDLTSTITDSPIRLNGLTNSHMVGKHPT
jgi:hypothetical protein